MTDRLMYTNQQKHCAIVFIVSQLYNFERQNTATNINTDTEGDNK